MATFNKVNVFTRDLVNGVHNFSSHTFKVILTNTAPTAASAVKADITELGGGNGYTAGGHTVAMAVSTASGVAKVTATDVRITAAAGSIGPFRYAVLINDTQTTPLKPVIGWADYGTNLTLLDGEFIDVDFDGTNGLYTAT